MTTALVIALSPTIVLSAPVPAAAPAPVHALPVPVPARVPAAPSVASARASAAASVRLPSASTLSAGNAPAPIPIVLPPPPAVVDSTSNAFSSAWLAIAQAQQMNPQAAQTASFAYVHAVQQYRSGNFAGARESALQALSIASGAQVRAIVPEPLPTAALVSVPAQVPGLAGGLYGADAAAIDAGSFIALARGILDDCAARHDRRLAGAQTHFAQAQADYAAGNFNATRTDAKAAIDACAKPQK